MKSLIKRLLFTPKIAKKIVKQLLKIHTLSYNYIGTFSIAAENGLHPKHRLMNYHKFFVDNVSANDMVLDIGCGNGALTYDLAKKTKYVYGIDINAKNIEYARKKYNTNNITYIVGDATEYEFNDKFDVIVLSNVLEHIENRIDFLLEIADLSNIFLIRVPMINRDWVVLYKKEIGLPFMSDPTHYTEYTLESFFDEMHQAGLKVNNYSIQFGEIWAKVSK
ncbi:MAG: class I SAM-dependent methyltransferase [Nitrospirota bacterium]